MPRQPEPAKTVLIISGLTPKSLRVSTGRPTAMASSAAVEDTVTSPRAAAAPGHRPGGEVASESDSSPCRTRVGVQLRIRPWFVVRLPLGAERPELDHRRTRLGQGQQDLLPVGAGATAPWPGQRRAAARRGGGSAPSAAGRRIPGRREGTATWPTRTLRHAELVGQLGELGDLPVAVQTEHVAPGPQGDGPRRGRHADPGQAGDQYRTVDARSTGAAVSAATTGPDAASRTTSGVPGATPHHGRIGEHRAPAGRPPLAPARPTAAPGS